MGDKDENWQVILPLTDSKHLAISTAKDYSSESRFEDGIVKIGLVTCSPKPMTPSQSEDGGLTEKTCAHLQRHQNLPAQPKPQPAGVYRVGLSCQSEAVPERTRNRMATSRSGIKSQGDIQRDVVITSEMTQKRNIPKIVIGYVDSRNVEAFSMPSEHVQAADRLLRGGTESPAGVRCGNEPI
jgi:hypothetical protein